MLFAIQFTNTVVVFVTALYFYARLFTSMYEEKRTLLKRLVRMGQENATMQDLLGDTAFKSTVRIP